MEETYLSILMITYCWQYKMSVPRGFFHRGYSIQFSQPLYKTQLLSDNFGTNVQSFLTDPMASFPHFPYSEDDDAFERQSGLTKAFYDPYSEDDDAFERQSGVTKVFYDHDVPSLTTSDSLPSAFESTTAELPIESTPFGFNALAPDPFGLVATEPGRPCMPSATYQQSLRGPWAALPDPSPLHQALVPYPYNLNGLGCAYFSQTCSAPVSKHAKKGTRENSTTDTAWPTLIIDQVPRPWIRANSVEDAKKADCYRFRQCVTVKQNKTKQKKRGRTLKCPVKQCLWTGRKKGNWIRHLKDHWPTEIWTCRHPACEGKEPIWFGDTKGDTKVKAHYNTKHKGQAELTDVETEDCCIAVLSRFPRACNFENCGAIFQSFSEFAYHGCVHYERGDKARKITIDADTGENVYHPDDNFSDDDSGPD